MTRERSLKRKQRSSLPRWERPYRGSFGYAFTVAGVNVMWWHREGLSVTGIQRTWRKRLVIRRNP